MILLKIGCDGGDITISDKSIHGVMFYQFSSIECFVPATASKRTFTTLEDCWEYLKVRYTKWYQLYLVHISTQMTELVKKDYIMAPDKNEYTIDAWLKQLTGRGIGF